MKVRVGHRNRFADAVEDRMDELDLNTAQLQAKVGDAVSYEHIRKITRGEAFPSDRALRALCDALALDFDEMKRLVDEVKVREKYGDVLAEMTGRPRGLDRLERYWKQLKVEQIETLLDVVEVIARRNRNSSKKRVERQRQLHLDVR